MTQYSKMVAIAVAAAAATPAIAAFDPTTNVGDLILGAQVSSGTGAATVLEVNLGAANLYKNPGSSDILVGNIGAELVATFGSTWYDSTNFFFGVSGASSSDNSEPGSADANGDFNSTMYVSRARSANGTPGSASSTAWGSPTPLTSPQIATASGGMIAQYGTYNSLQTGGVAIIPTTASNDWKDLNPVTATIQSAAYGNTFSGGIQFRTAAGEFATTGDFAGLTDVQGVVDLYRIVRFADGGGTVGVGSYVGSFALEQDGDVHFIATPVPEMNAALMLGLLPVAGLCLRRRQAILA